ncbi:glutamate--tRNA ligase [Candidatus Gottesmanbacteria bacterium RIFCSPHIGHO2_02_FULL_39_14]|uniref:Glutamate--tRNA ligase n=2 Tax=Candidatus Gottesmaniibacteriota TaxID=1752720 RepID=A0A1F6A1K6_9BACT|nr:MAG: glutamate--tRNA ligase [Candidatus Gottesmanbacteria bacterium RBG_16_38_7b]OGG18558.1 MAG: glutamate--tRNA ligase [Candidatus Gottesmanbacteria bacterium RIFCSPHIGHO2_02_FULL_39_14]
MQTVRVRIAPSPTGSDLHIGNVYTALINFVFAKKNRGKFIVRIEDTDRTRLVKGAEGKILSSLKWFNIYYDEGPDIGGPLGPYRQSERLSLYKKYAHKLVGKGNAYYCFCNSSRLNQMRKRQMEKGQPTLYDGFCRHSDPRISAKRIIKEKFVIRLKVPRQGTTVFNDLIRGPISFANKLIDDQVLLKSDGYPTYHLGVVVDDHLMEISHVIRAEEWISSTPKHVLIYKFLGWQLPVFAHGPILRNPDKSKLSKRKNPVWASWYKEQGFLPEAILNYLALMGWSHPEGKDIFSRQELIDKFRLEDLKAVGPAFDLVKLEWLNGEYIRQTQNSKLKTQIYEFLDKKYPQELISKTIPLIKERIKKLSDYLPLCRFFFEEPENYEWDIISYRSLLSKIVLQLENLNQWKSAIIGQTMKVLAEKLKIKNSEFFMVLRVAVTGQKVTPPLNESMEILGKEKILSRIKKLINEKNPSHRHQ